MNDVKLTVEFSKVSEKGNFLTGSNCHPVEKQLKCKMDMDKSYMHCKAQGEGPTSHKVVTARSDTTVRQNGKIVGVYVLAPVCCSCCIIGMINVVIGSF